MALSGIYDDDGGYILTQENDDMDGTMVDPTEDDDTATNIPGVPDNSKPSGDNVPLNLEDYYITGQLQSAEFGLHCSHN